MSLAIGNRVRITRCEHTGRPEGIRDQSGYILFFREVRKYPGQEERYNTELAQLDDIAESILAGLRAQLPTEDDDEKGD